MSLEKMAVIAGALFCVIVVAIGGVLLRRRRPKKVASDYFLSQWQGLQRLCKDKKSWKDALVSADDLLDTALKNRRMSGKTMGERLVSAQHLIGDNDAVWFGHKLRAKLDTAPKTRLKQTDVKLALMGIRQALKDLGALK